MRQKTILEYVGVSHQDKWGEPKSTIQVTEGIAGNPRQEGTTERQRQETEEICRAGMCGDRPGMEEEPVTNDSQRRDAI